jgi:hypothetical protein
MTLMLMARTRNELPGMTGAGVAPVAIEDVDKCVDKYVELRNTRMEYNRLEVEAKRALISSLHANEDKIGRHKDGALVYRHDDLIITLRTGKDDLKVELMEGAEDED